MGGRTDKPHLQAAREGLTAEHQSEMFSELQDWTVRRAEAANFRTVGIYAGRLGVGDNADIVDENPLACRADLLDAWFAKDEAFGSLAALHNSISQYTQSGSASIRAAATAETALGLVFTHDAVAQTVQGAPIVAVGPCEGTRFEVGAMSIIEGGPNPDHARLFHDWTLTPAVQEIGAANNSFQIPSNTNAATPDAAPRLEDITLIDYNFALYGASEEWTRLPQRWDADTGSLTQEIPVRLILTSDRAGVAWLALFALSLW